jgi:hypothetical protein
MQKLTGWTKNPFVGCDKCESEGRIVCQATRYSISKTKGSSEWKTKHYCQYHADLVDPPAKRLERQKKKELERAKESMSDDRERDWHYVSGAHKYM